MLDVAGLWTVNNRLKDEVTDIDRGYSTTFCTTLGPGVHVDVH